MLNYISNSGAIKADKCLFAFWNEYLNKTNTGPDDRLGSIFGSAYGKLMELFYANKMWRTHTPKKVLEELHYRTPDIVSEVISSETTATRTKPAGKLLWKNEENPKALYASSEEIVADIRDHLKNGLETIRKNSLIGIRAEAEPKLDYRFQNGVTLGGRADFIIQRLKPYNDLIIVDGKGSKWRDKYVKPQQLTWYAMLYNLHAVKNGEVKKLPDKTAFLFWKHPVGTNVDFVDVSQDDVDTLLEATLEQIKTIQSLEKKLPTKPTLEMARGVFKPKPSKDACQYCKYRSLCPPGDRYMEVVENEYARKR